MLTTQIEPFFRSQWNQDKIIFEHLMDFQDGTFFEVGAHDGEALSNTFFFEKALGWKGILVEMQPSFHQEIKRKRTRSLVFSCGLAAEPGKLLWLDAGDRSGLLRYFEHAAVEYLENHYKNVKDKPTFHIHWVDVRPITDLLAESDTKHIDYFSLDVEGGEMAILKSIDFNRITVDLFTIEDNSGFWFEHRSYLEPLGYRFIGSAGTDGFFLHERFLDRLATQRGADYLHGIQKTLAPPRAFVEI